MCLRPLDLDAEARRLQPDPRAASRLNSDGKVTRWRLLGMEAALGPERLPYFIDWGADEPAHLSPGGDGEGDGFAWVEHGGDATRVQAWIGDRASTLPLRLDDGPPGVHAATVRRGDRVVAIA